MPELCQPQIETERLILREILLQDAGAMFEMDSDPQVHTYLGNDPVKDIEQINNAIRFIRKQYVDNGIGRWAVVLKETNEFIGWCGLKYFTETINKHIHIYDLGYRFNKKYWGKGYATEAAKACMNYGFNKMNLKEIYAMTDSRNLNSNKVLKKLGFSFIEKFDYDGDESDWFKITAK
ncbi:MAG: GNAT family N-acetyltransferase [Bacteroidia bacterium]|nr:GNAT family N-acetyltransferase [Bacteroidia bacterium]